MNSELAKAIWAFNIFHLINDTIHVNYIIESLESYYEIFY